MMLLYSLGYRMYFFLKRFRRWGWLGGAQKYAQKLYLWYDYYFSLFLNRKLAPWLERHPVSDGLNRKARTEHYTASLTSFPARIEYVHIAIDTLMRQSFKPDRIVLWLAESQFPERKLPESLTRLCDRGLTIRFCDDLRSHKKYFYAFQEYPEDNIILTDDDIFYAPDTIARLVKAHRKHPKDIIGTAAQLIGPSLSSLPSQWPAVENGKKYEQTLEAQPFTGMGTLYPPRWYPPELFNKEKALSLAGTADDLWLKAMSLAAGVKTTLVYPVRGFPVDIQIKKNQTLFQMNGTQGENLNDRVWQALVEECGLQ